MSCHVALKRPTLCVCEWCVCANGVSCDVGYKQSNASLASNPSLTSMYLSVVCGVWRRSDDSPYPYRLIPHPSTLSLLRGACAIRLPSHSYTHAHTHTHSLSIFPPHSFLLSLPLYLSLSLTHTHTHTYTQCRQSSARARNSRRWRSSSSSNNRKRCSRSQ